MGRKRGEQRLTCSQITDCICLTVSNCTWVFFILLFLSSFFSPDLRPTFSLLLQFGRTEVIDNTLNPDFVRKYILDYFFEEKQNLRFDLWVISFEVTSLGVFLSCPLSSFTVMYLLLLCSGPIERPTVTASSRSPKRRHSSTKSQKTKTDNHCCACSCWQYKLCP